MSRILTARGSGRVCADPWISICVLRHLSIVPLKLIVKLNIKLFKLLKLGHEAARRA